MSFLRPSWLRWGRYWLPAIFWMGLIFFLSSQTEADMPHYPDGKWDWFLKKLAHMAEYGILTLLVWRAISGSIGDQAKRRYIWVTPIICAIYAASDEYHQSFIAGRRSSVLDVVIDTLGILLTFGGMSALLRWRAKHPSWFQVYPWLDHFLNGFLPLRPAVQDNISE